MKPTIKFVLLPLLALVLSDTQAASYLGTHVSSSVPSTVVLGASIPITTTVRNTGTAYWDSFDQPGWLFKFYDMSWQPGISITYYVWNDVSSGSQVVNTRSFSGVDLPKTPGTYQFKVYAYYPVNYWSGQYSLMSSSPKYLQFTVVPAAVEISAPLRLGAPALLAGGQFQFQLSGPAGSNCAIEASGDLVSWTSLGVKVIPGGGVLSFTDTSATNHVQRFYRAVWPQAE